MKSYLVKTPQLISSLYRSQVWSFSKEENNIYLTFDDGPTPDITEWVLELLNQYNASATFFCVGKNIEQYPYIFKKIVNSGHGVGNHTYDHLNGWKWNTTDYVKSVLRTEKVINKLDPTILNKLFRPPYGKIKTAQARELSKHGYQIIMWSVLSGDFDQGITNDQCLKNVISNTENGSIIVFHDSVKAFDKLRAVLPKTLNFLTNKGYKFKKIGT